MCILSELTKPLSSAGRFPPSELSYRIQILGQFLAWLLDSYVVGLVRACFYVTEIVGQKNALRFYRQEVWAKLQDLAFRYTCIYTPAKVHTCTVSGHKLTNHYCDVEVTSPRVRWRS